MSTERQGPNTDADAGSDWQDAPATESEETRQERERISRRAYERFQERGSEHGRDQEDWYEAERELRDRNES